MVEGRGREIEASSFILKKKTMLTSFSVVHWNKITKQDARFTGGQLLIKSNAKHRYRNFYFSLPSFSLFLPKKLLPRRRFFTELIPTWKSRRILQDSFAILSNLFDLFVLNPSGTFSLRAGKREEFQGRKSTGLHCYYREGRARLGAFFRGFHPILEL